MFLMIWDILFHEETAKKLQRNCKETTKKMQRNCKEIPKTALTAIILNSFFMYSILSIFLFSNLFLFSFFPIHFYFSCFTRALELYLTLVLVLFWDGRGYYEIKNWSYNFFLNWLKDIYQNKNSLLKKFLKNQP